MYILYLFVDVDMNGELGMQILGRNVSDGYVIW